MYGNLQFIFSVSDLIKIRSVGDEFYVRLQMLFKLAFFNMKNSFWEHFLKFQNRSGMWPII